MLQNLIAQALTSKDEHRKKELPVIIKYFLLLNEANHLSVYDVYVRQRLYVYTLVDTKLPCSGNE